MLRGLSLLFIALVLTLSAEAQNKKRRAARAKTTTEKQRQETQAEPAAEKPDKKTEPATPEARAPEATPVAEAPAANPADEMGAYRAIQQRPLSTVQDMVDIILMYRGEFGKFKSAETRLARARELKFIKSQPGEEKLERGTLAYAIMKTYHPESGWLFWITGFEHYAMRDVQQAEIMPAKATEGQNITGEQLLGTITAAEEFAQKRDSHGKK